MGILDDAYQRMQHHMTIMAAGTMDSPESGKIIDQGMTKMTGVTSEEMADFVSKFALDSLKLIQKEIELAQLQGETSRLEENIAEALTVMVGGSLFIIGWIARDIRGAVIEEDLSTVEHLVLLTDSATDALDRILESIRKDEGTWFGISNALKGAWEHLLEEAQPVLNITTEDERKEMIMHALLMTGIAYGRKTTKDLAKT